MKRIALLLIFIFVLAACASSPGTGVEPTRLSSPISNIPATPRDDPALLPTLFPDAERNPELSRLDEQGAVIFEVTPLNLATPADTLEFDVAMNTHSVDLSMDLAALSTLSTDADVTVQASKWVATPGGHHVSGTLIFPVTQDGKSILEDASELTLTIVNVDSASRVFEWDLK